MFKKRKTFLELSRRERRSLVLDLKHKMEKEKAEYGGKFYADTYFNTQDNDPERKTTRHWADIVFPSKKDPSILWNATIMTACEELSDNLIFGINTEPYIIYEQYVIYKNYVYGIGLTIIVHEKDLNQEAVERAIENFYQAGEKAWISETPVDKNELLEIMSFRKASEGFII